MSNQDGHPIRVGASRPNQLMHTFGVGAVTDMPNLSVIIRGLDDWDYRNSETNQHPIVERRLLAAVRLLLGSQVDRLRLPPYRPDELVTRFGAEGPQVGVPVGLFPTWLRCTDSKCNQLGLASGGLFDLVRHFVPERIKYVHKCRGEGNSRPLAVPARFVLACPNGHLDDFPWQYFAHDGIEPAGDHTLKLTETGTTGEASDVFVECGCGVRRQMSLAFGAQGTARLPACRGRHPHLETWESCGKQSRTMVLGATNSWFPMRLATITVPRAFDPVAHVVAEYWLQLSTLLGLDEDTARALLPSMYFWPEFDRYGFDRVWATMQTHAKSSVDDSDEHPADDLLTPEWKALTAQREFNLPDFTTRREDSPQIGKGWLSEQVMLVTRLREVSALYGFTRIDSPPWDVMEGMPDSRRAPLAEKPPTWVPCADARGEGVFLRFREDRIVRWERAPEVVKRERQLRAAHVDWRRARQLDLDGWPGIRYVLLHSFAHALIREFALESGYGAAGIRERIYARDGMAGILLYTAAPDSEGTLGGLVSLGRKDRLDALITQALEAARLCSSDPLCAEHNPIEQARLYGAACHACLFASETSCERGNHYLDRALLVDTMAGGECGFLTDALERVRRSS